MELKRITVNALKKRLDLGESIFLIDTRGPDAWNDSNVKIKGAVRLHFSQVSEHLDKVPRDRTIVTYCT